MNDRHDSDRSGAGHGKGGESEGRHAGRGDLDKIREQGVVEVDQEAAGRKADESAQAARRASAARISFESQQKEQARQLAVEDQARADADRAARENYAALNQQEDEAHERAASDAREAGRDWDSEPIRNGEVI